MTKDINSLPILPMLLIFDKLPVHDLLKANQVCLRWKYLQAQAIHSRRQLSLLVGTDPLDRIHGSVFNIPLLDQVINDDGSPLVKVPVETILQSSLTFNRSEQIDVNLLVQTFPKVSYLLVVHNKTSVDALQTLSRLLHHWRATLTTLEVMVWYNDVSGHSSQWIPTSHSLPVMTAINALPALKSLKLEIHHYLKPVTLNQHFEIPILAQLKKFQFYSNDSSASLLPGLNRFGRENRQLKRISIANQCFPPIKDYQEVNPDIAGHIDLFTANWEEIAWSQGFLDGLAPENFDVNQFTSRFCSLRALTLQVNRRLELAPVLHSLTTLANLKYLELFLNGLDPFEDGPTSETCLSSVKALRLTLPIYSHMTLSRLPPAFPALQVLDILPKNFTCYLCGLREGQGQTRLKACICTLLKPFVVCRSLRKIYFDNRWFPQWTLADLK